MKVFATKAVSWRTTTSQFPTIEYLCEPCTNQLIGTLPKGALISARRLGPRQGGSECMSCRPQAPSLVAAGAAYRADPHAADDLVAAAAAVLRQPHRAGSEWCLCYACAVGRRDAHARGGAGCGCGMCRIVAHAEATKAGAV